ncbi:MAG: hypothetical protein RLZZ450_4240 [Pseudomonadota bacterium]|jgi:hypothetical protein
MKRATCDQAWQVEVDRDGRLDAHARAALEPHLSGCATCRLERQKLDELAQGLSAIGGDVDAMSLRRLRQRTLESANAEVTQSAPQKRWPRALGWTLAACVSVAAAVVVVGMPLRPPAVAPGLAVVVVADHDAKWQRFVERDIERVDLSAGTLLFRVARKPADPRLIVRVPDGVIEDLGTTFSVSVRDGETSEISVQEGHVLFHRRGEAALHLVAGSTWTPPLEPMRSSSPPTTTAPATPRARDPQGAGPANAPSPPNRRPMPSASAHRPAAHAGQESWVSDTGEDEAYLHIVALLREGRSAEARLAAFAYLKAYPTGFRRLEVKKVASAPPAQANEAQPLE